MSHFVKINDNYVIINNQQKNNYSNVLVAEGLIARLACRFSAPDVTGLCYKLAD